MSKKKYPDSIRISLVETRSREPKINVFFRYLDNPSKNSEKNFEMTRKGVFEVIETIWPIVVCGESVLTYSSSVDFPRDYKPRSNLYVREIIDKEILRRAEEIAKIKESLWEKIFWHCAADFSFMESLHGKELELMRNTIRKKQADANAKNTKANKRRH